MKRRILTYFDVHYAARGLAMIESLMACCPSAELTVLCLDDLTERILAAELGDRVTTVSCAELARFQPRLLEARSGRSPWEFYATQKPVFIEWAMDRAAVDEPVCYVDADAWFFSSPEPLFEELRGASIGISPHRFHESTRSLAVYGRFNAGFGIWRNDFIGRSCVGSWTEECLDWCHGRVEGERFMNQGYLNSWPRRFPRVAVLEHPGHNLASWNLASHRISQRRQGVFVDAQPLVFYHFSSLFRNPIGLWQTTYTSPRIRHPLVLDGIYRPYISALERVSRRLSQRYRIDGLGTVRSHPHEVLTLAVSRAA